MGDSDSPGSYAPTPTAADPTRITFNELVQALVAGGLDRNDASQSAAGIFALTLSQRLQQGAFRG